jgi:hypothetical protein
MVSIGWPQALAWRMRRQLLDPVGSESVEGVVRRLGAIQAQVETAAATSPATSIRLLPGNGQRVFGPGTADWHIVPPARRALVGRGANIVLRGGVVSGTWTISRDDIVLDWFSEAGAAPESGPGDEVDRLAGILGRPLRLSVRTA